MSVSLQTHCVASWKGTYCIFCAWSYALKGAHLDIGLKRLPESHLALWSSHLDIISLGVCLLQETPAINIIWIKLVICPFSPHWWLWAGFPGISYSHAHDPPIPLFTLNAFVTDIKACLFQRCLYLPCTLISNHSDREAVLKHCPANLQFGKSEGLTVFDDSNEW